MIVFEDVTFSYEGSSRKALDGVSLRVEEGDFLGIIGPSGAGKSTLAYAAVGAIPHSLHGDFYGSVRVAGRDTFEVDLTELAHTVGAVFQDIDAQMVASVVEDELAFGLENLGIPRDEGLARIEKTLAQVGIADLRAREVSSLSGGQKQKVALAAVLALRPRALVLDEPTGELDPQSSRQVFELLRELNEQGVTVVVIEQKIMLLGEFARHLAVMDSGRLSFYGETRSVLSRADDLKRLGVNVPRVATFSLGLRAKSMGSGRLCTSLDEAEALVREVIGVGADALDGPVASCGNAARAVEALLSTEKEVVA